MTVGATIHMLNTCWKWANSMSQTRPSWKSCLDTTSCTKPTNKRYGTNSRKAKRSKSTTSCLKRCAGSGWCTNTNATFKMIHMTSCNTHCAKRWQPWVSKHTWSGTTTAFMKRINSNHSSICYGFTANCTDSKQTNQLVQMLRLIY